MGNRAAIAPGAGRDRNQLARRFLQDVPGDGRSGPAWPRKALAWRIVRCLEPNNASTGGGYIVHNGEQRFIRGQALLKNVADIERVVVRKRTDGVPLLVRDVATVSVAPMTRQGAVTRDGRGEAVTGMVMMLIGENSRTVVHAGQGAARRRSKRRSPRASGWK